MTIAEIIKHELDLADKLVYGVEDEWWDKQISAEASLKMKLAYARARDWLHSWYSVGFSDGSVLAWSVQDGEWVCG